MHGNFKYILMYLQLFFNVFTVVFSMYVYILMYLKHLSIWLQIELRLVPKSIEKV